MTARPWDEAWQQALYGTDGFYRRAAPAEHFATSAQGIPGAGRVLAEAVAELCARHGCDRVVDVGAGRGELLRSLREVAPGLHLTGVDVVPRPEGLDVDAWLVAPGGAALPDALRDLGSTLVLAHEWLDVVPCPVVERDEQGVWREVRVRRSADGAWRESLGPAVDGDDLAWAQRWLEPAPLIPGDDSSAVMHRRRGTASAYESVVRGEIGRPRESALADLVGRVRSGLVVVVDYGHTAADRPRHGSLTGFRDGREVEPVPDGSCDLTAHVAVDALVASLPSPTGHPLCPPLSPTEHPVVTPPTPTGHPLCPQRQREVLHELLGDPSPPVPHDLAREQPQAYLEALARRAALRALTSGALGDFWWLVVEVGDQPPGRA